MTIGPFKSGFEYLVLGVRSYLTDAGVTAFVGCGFRELPKQSNQGEGGGNRIVFLASEENGNAGRIVSVRDPGTRTIHDPDDDTIVIGETRSLGDWDRSVVLSVWAHDSTAPRDELAQQVAVERLLEWAKRGVDRVGFADIAWGAVRAIDTKENTLGAELRVGLTFSSPIYDEPLEVATPGFVLPTKE